MRDGVENQPDNWKEQIASEIGDVLWYCAALATDLNVSLGMIASLNEKKLQDRYDRGKLNGSGDNR
jgi:NTP pyrophosphatase (non-canonical NTP hydrolase)